MSLLTQYDHRKIYEADPSRKDLAKWRDWKSVLNKYRRFNNIRIIEEYDINPYLFLADLMITDYGGASLEFICMDKPIIYLDCPGFFEIRGQEVFEKEARKTGCLLQNPREIPDAIKLAINDPEPYKSNRNKLIKKLMYSPGHAAERGVQSLFNLVKDDLVSRY